MWAVSVLALVPPLLLLLYGYGRAHHSAFSLDGRVVLITGAGHGIGRRLAATIRERAPLATLVLLDVDAQALEALRGPRVLVAACDVSDDRAVDACVAHVQQQLGRSVDVLVNNAGVVAGRSLLALSPALVRRTFGVNTLAHFWTTRAVLPTMLADPSREALIVTISSMMAFLGCAGLSDYCGSKAATSTFHESLRMELQRDCVTHVRTLLVCPSAVGTGMFAGAFEGAGWRMRLARWLASFLDEQEVVDCIFDAMISGRQQLLVCSRGWRGWVLPWASPITRLLPVELSDVIVGLVGGHHCMDSFVGHAAAAERSAEDGNEDVAADKTGKMKVM